jgi:ABC-type cobalamin/Fe3+-siderophores transport system ATPase subunit
MKLSADGLVLSYGADPVVDGVTLHVPEGRISILIGPNGSGKSTILRALSRLLKPISGQVLLDGEAIRTLSTRQVARKLAILPQQATAPQEITVEQLVWYGRHPHRRLIGAPTPADRAAVEWAIEATGLTNERATQVDELSGGQRQRAWISLALAQETEILLLDEPTTFLDLSHQLDVLELCARLNREQGKTVVMVLHDVNLAAEFADRMFVIDKGRLRAQGSPEQVLTTDLMRDVFGIESQIVPHPLSGRPLCIPLRKVPPTDPDQAQNSVQPTTSKE